ncbi:MAG: hypothetical protein Q9157_005098 [Trypethelium eluteriae]
MANVHTGYIIDWDQRRWYAVKGSPKLLPDDDTKEIDVLKRHIDQLARNVYSITVDDEGLLVSVSTNPEEDPTLITHFPRYATAPSLQDCSTVKLSSLTEVDRLGPGVDLMSYAESPTVEKKVVFKYSMIFERRRQIWAEMHLLKSLPRHANLIPFDSVVLDDVESRVLGFTTTYIPGGTLDKNRDQTFRFEWLQQLTAVVDFLNLGLGVIHQDIAPRNLVIDPETDKIRLFDFDRAARIGHPGCFPERNDISGLVFTLYELVTYDEQFRKVPFEEQDPETVQNLDWPVKRRLDSDISLFRNHLNAWVHRRTEACEVGDTQDFKTSDTPDIPPPSPIITGYNELALPTYETAVVRMRTDALKLKQNIVSWERPPQRAIKLHEFLPPTGRNTKCLGSDPEARVINPSDLLNFHESRFAYLDVRLYDQLSWRTGYQRHPSRHKFIIEFEDKSITSYFRKFEHLPDDRLNWNSWADKFEKGVQTNLSNFQGTLRNGILQRNPFPSLPGRQAIPDKADRLRIWKAEASEEDKEQRRLDFEEQVRLYGMEIVEQHGRTRHQR